MGGPWCVCGRACPAAHPKVPFAPPLPCLFTALHNRGPPSGCRLPTGPLQTFFGVQSMTKTRGSENKSCFRFIKHVRKILLVKCPRPCRKGCKRRLEPWETQTVLCKSLSLPPVSLFLRIYFHFRLSVLPPCSNSAVSSPLLQIAVVKISNLGCLRRVATCRWCGSGVHYLRRRRFGGS